MQALRIVQLSDSHLVGAPTGSVRGRQAFTHWQQALEKIRPLAPDLLLLSGDCCDDESWCGYALLRDSLSALPESSLVVVSPGNHDHPGRLRACLGSRVRVAPDVLVLKGWSIVILSSHWSGHCAGRIGAQQLRWLDGVLKGPDFRTRPLLLALHHPPQSVEHKDWDRIGLVDSKDLIGRLKPLSQLRITVFGHLHQNWEGWLAGRRDVSLLGCPSTLCSFPPLQPVSHQHCEELGGRLLTLHGDGSFENTLLQWPDQTADWQS